MHNLDIKKLILADIKAGMQKILKCSEEPQDFQKYEIIKDQMDGLDTDTLFIIKAMVDQELTTAIDKNVVTADSDVKEEAENELDTENVDELNPEESDNIDQMLDATDGATEDMSTEDSMEESSPIIDKLTSLEDYTEDVINLLDNAMDNIFDMGIVNDLVDIKIFVNDKIAEILKNKDTMEPEELIQELDEFKTALDGYKDKIDELNGNTEKMDVPESGNEDNNADEVEADDYAEDEKMEQNVESSVVQSNLIVQEATDPDGKVKYYVANVPDGNDPNDPDADPANWEVLLETYDKNEAMKKLKEQQEGINDSLNQLRSVQSNVEEDFEEDEDVIVGTEEDFSDIESEEKFDDGTFGENYSDEPDDDINSSESFNTDEEDTSVSFSDSDEDMENPENVDEVNYADMLKNLTQVTTQLDDIKEQVENGDSEEAVKTSVDEVKTEVEEVKDIIEDKPSTNADSPMEEELEDLENPEMPENSDEPVEEVTDEDLEEKVDEIEAAMSSTIIDEDHKVKRTSDQKGMPKLNKKSVELL